MSSGYETLDDESNAKEFLTGSRKKFTCFEYKRENMPLLNYIWLSVFPTQTNERDVRLSANVLREFYRFCGELIWLC